jgi:hypothetical protein
LGGRADVNDQMAARTALGERPDSGGRRPRRPAVSHDEDFMPVPIREVRTSRIRRPDGTDRREDETGGPEDRCDEQSYILALGSLPHWAANDTRSDPTAGRGLENRFRQ